MIPNETRLHLGLGTQISGLTNYLHICGRHARLRTVSRSGKSLARGTAAQPIIAAIIAMERRNSPRHLTHIAGVAVLSTMAKEKNPRKDIFLWIVTVALVALAFFWYKR